MKLTKEQAKEICKVGQGEDCCIYLIMSSGWECVKSDKNLKDHLHKKWLSGTTNAKGVGDTDDCPFKLLNKEKS